MPPLLVCGPICLCLPDVCGLDGLIATTEQEERPWTTLDIVHTVARAAVDAEFGDSVAHGRTVPRIPRGEAFDPCEDASSSMYVAESVEPGGEQGRLAKFHD